MGEKRKMTDEEKRRRNSLRKSTRRKNLIASGLCCVCGSEKSGNGVTLCSLCQERSHTNKRLHNKRLRFAVIAKYGGVCQCCGESNRKLLTIDHINNDGAKDRNGKRASNFRLILKGPIRSDLRVLCYNCNCGRAHNGGVCPHEEKQDDE